MKFDLDHEISELLSFAPYGLPTRDHHVKLLPILNGLTEHHYNSCSEYSRIIDGAHGGFSPAQTIEELPYLPVRLFKELDLMSVSSDEIVKKMNSSGTSGLNASRIYLDKKTVSIQTKVLSRIVASKIGQKRLPMIILDCEASISSRTAFSARAAGILGFSTFSSSKFYALDDDMNLRIPELIEFIKEASTKRFLLFGFTFIVWEHFVQALVRADLKLDLSESILIHGGGWKKIQEQYRVSNLYFKERISHQTQINEVIDYYGMVEQTGSLYLECIAGNLHSSLYSEVIFRHPNTLLPIEPGQTGVIQVNSLVGISYPGHVLLTEDLGTFLGDDDCPCGNQGRYFQINGRVESAEIRGCSDTYRVGVNL